MPSPSVQARPTSTLRPVRVPIGAGKRLDGDLSLAPESRGLVVLAHGSGSSRRSERNRRVAHKLQRAELGTLLFDLLTPDEEEAERFGGKLRFDIALLSERLIFATEWLGSELPRGLPVGYLGASTGAAAALRAAALMPASVRAIVSRGGRPDLAEESLPRVQAPTLLIVGGADDAVLKRNLRAYEALRSTKSLEIIPGATHLFEEDGALDMVSMFATRWFSHYLS